MNELTNEVAYVRILRAAVGTNLELKKKLNWYLHRGRITKIQFDKCMKMAHKNKSSTYYKNINTGIQYGISKTKYPGNDF